MAIYTGVCVFIDTQDELVHRLSDDTQDWWVDQNINTRTRAIAQCGFYPIGKLVHGNEAIVTCMLCMTARSRR